MRRRQATPLFTTGVIDRPGMGEAVAVIRMNRARRLEAQKAPRTERHEAWSLALHAVRVAGGRGRRLEAEALAGVQATFMNW